MRKALLLLAVPVLFGREQAGLQSEIERIASQAHGHVGVACALPGRTLACDVNADSDFPMQSVYKLPIAMATLHAIQQHRFTIDQQIQFERSDLISPSQHSPLREEYPKGDVPVRIEELLRLAVSESDGVASDILLRTAGGPVAVEEYLKSLGLFGIHIRDNEKTIGMDVRAQYRNSAQPQAMVALLRLLADRSPLSPEHTKILFRWMTETHTGEHRLKGLLPANTTVAHKTGTSGQDHGITHATDDVGLITLRDGSRLAIAVFVCDSPESEKVREGVIAQIAKAIWDAANR